MYNLRELHIPLIFLVANILNVCSYEYVSAQDYGRPMVLQVTPHLQIENAPKTFLDNEYSFSPDSVYQLQHPNDIMESVQKLYWDGFKFPAETTIENPDLAPDILPPIDPLDLADVNGMPDFLSGSTSPMMWFRTVNPADAVNVIETQLIEHSPLPRPDIAASLDEQSAAAQRSACSSAVTTLTKSLPGDAINEFAKTCIGSSLSPWASGQVSDLQKSITGACIDAYENYRTQCLGKGGLETERINYFVGIVTRRAAGDRARDIICTATLVGPNIAITAAHCLNDFSLPGPRAALSFQLTTSVQDERNVVAFAQAPDFKLTDLAGDPRKLVFRTGFLKSHDIAFLLLGRSPQGGHTETGAVLFPGFSTAGPFDRLALMGYQALAKRELVLKTLRETGTYLEDEALLGAGTWTQFMMSETTPHCMAIKPSDDRASDIEIGHQCQSFGGTSGAPMFLVKNGETTLEIGAIHTLAAELQGSDAMYVANEGVSLQPDLAMVRDRLEREFAKAFD